MMLNKGFSSHSRVSKGAPVPTSAPGAGLCAAGRQVRVKCNGSELREGIYVNLGRFGQVRVSRRGKCCNFSTVFKEM